MGLDFHTYATLRATAPEPESTYDELRPSALADEAVPAHYGTDLTGWFRLREILDDLRRERVLV